MQMYAMRPDFLDNLWNTCDKNQPDDWGAASIFSPLLGSVHKMIILVIHRLRQGSTGWRRP